MNDNQSQTVAFKNTAFKFSGASLDSLDALEYTLFDLELDSSYSIANYTRPMREMVKTVLRACQKSPRSDNLLVRLGTFATQPEEFHGFTELNKCDLTRYDELLLPNKLGNSTALFDAAVSGVDAVNAYGKELADSDYSVNALVVFITDGMDNHSSFTAKEVGRKLKEGVGERKLESLTSILIGVNIQDNYVAQSLDHFHKEAGLTQFVAIDKLDENAFAKLGGFISKSISSTSTALSKKSAPISVSF